MIVTTGPEGTINASVVLLYSGGTDPVIGTDAITYTAPPASGGTTGTGAQVLATSPTIATPTLTGTVTASTGDIKIGTAGKGLFVKEGSNAKQGTATLSSGTALVSNSAVTANSRIFLTAQTLGTVTAPSALTVSARVASTSFTILASQLTDTSIVAYEIFEPA
jgi:hypothetical protein